MISEFKNGDRLVSESFLVRKVEIRQAKTGNDYLSLTLGDTTGSIPAKVWSLVGIPSIAVGDVVVCSGEISEYNGELQVTLRTVSIDEGANKFDYCRKTKYTVSSLWDAMCNLLDSIEDEWCKKLVESFTEDEEFTQKFKNSSAAVTIHHDFVGGLLEHTLFIMRMCNNACTVYKQLNRDLLLTSAFLHDVGKLYEISEFPENAYTEFGHLIGHVAGSALMVDRVCEGIPGFPMDTRLKIEHCLLAHHGKLEWGSPKLPGLPEALVLSTLDNMDAKLKVFEEACTKEDFSTYNRVLGVSPAKGDFSE